MFDDILTRARARANRQLTSSLQAPRLVIICALGCCAAGCSGGSDSLSLPKIPEISVAAITPSAPEKPVGSPTEIYARVARGANTCWFGGSGPLKKDYIYHAEADAPSRGGKARIDIHVRDPSQPNPRGPKAFRINIEPEADGTSAAISSENLKMSEAMAAGMTSDVNRWAKGDQGCAGSSTVAGWGTVPAKAETAGKLPAKSAKPAVAVKPVPAAKSP